MSVEAEADAPELNVVVDEIVNEDHAVSIDISAALVDMDGLPSDKVNCGE